MNIDKKTLDLLNASGAACIEVRFQGGGDSGEITGTYITYQDDADKLPKEEEDALVESIESAAYEMLDRSGVDWYNDDGGQADVCLRRDEEGGWTCDIEVSVYTLERVHSKLYRVSEKEET